MKQTYRIGTAVALALALGGSACASTSTTRLNGAPEIPAAQGTVKTSEAKNGNTRVMVTVKHLTTPERVQPGANTFVVWVRPAGRGTPQNVGALNVDKDLEGTLNTVTPLKAFDVLITAEPSRTVMQPSMEQPLLWASVRRNPEDED